MTISDTFTFTFCRMKPNVFQTIDFRMRLYKASLIYSETRHAREVLGKLAKVTFVKLIPKMYQCTPKTCLITFPKLV